MDFNILNSSAPSVEAINFQGFSALSKKLIALGEEVIAFRQKEKSNKRVGRLTVQKFKSVYSLKNLSRIIKEETGITLDDVEYTAAPSLAWACVFYFGAATKQTVGDWTKAMAGYTGVPSRQEFDQHPDFEYRMAMLNSALNVDTGKVTPTVHKYHDDTLTLHFGLKLDPYAYVYDLVGHELAPKHTAEEIAAIILHELGHCVSFVEYCSHTCKTLADIDTTIRGAITENTKPEDIPEIVDSIASAVRKSKRISKDGKAEALKILDNIKTVSTSPVSSTSTLLIGIVSIMLSLVVGVIVGSLGNLHSWLTKSNVISMRAGQKTKLSDFGLSYNDLTTCERYADEYVVRHGLGHALISALDTLHKVTIGFKGAKATWDKSSTSSYLIGQIQTVVLQAVRGFNGDIVKRGNHGTTRDRANAIMADLLKVFKNRNMSPEQLDFYIAAFEKARDNYRTAIAEPTGTINDKLEALQLALTLPSIMDALVSGRISRNYNKLMVGAQALNSNILGYYGAKLDQINRQY